MDFDYYMPTRLITGRGCVRANAGVFARLGGKCILVTSGSAARKSGALNDVAAALDSVGVRHLLYDGVEQNPSLEGAKRAGDMAREFGAEFVIGIGGGSPLDAAKAAAVFAANDMEAMEVYGHHWPNPALPIALVGTTAGTGSEVGPFAVMTTPNGRKKSFGNEQTFARYSFCDAGYTDSLPLDFTVSTALDALSHALEGYFGTEANDLSDLYAREAVRLLFPALTELRGVCDAAEILPQLRDRLYYASILAGLTLTKCGTCYCHTLGYYFSERYGTPHGIACALFLSDFVRRETRLLPGKALRLFREAGCDEESLCGLIDDLHERPNVALDEETITELVDYLSTTKNMRRAAPDGYTAQEALALMKRLFGAGR